MFVDSPLARISPMHSYARNPMKKVDPGQGLIVAKGIKSWPPSIICDLLCAKRVATLTSRPRFFCDLALHKAKPRPMGFRLTSGDKHNFQDLVGHHFFII